MLTSLLLNFQVEKFYKEKSIERIMKNAILFLLIVVAINASAQSQPKSLKDLLYSGKMKVDSTAVTRKGDDLSTKIDTATKKAVVPAAQKTVPVAGDSRSGVAPLPTGADPTDSATNSAAIVKATAAPFKNNTKIWKDYTDSLVITLKTELLNSKKIKKETYFLTVDYEINTDGSVNILGVASSPANAFLQEEIKNRITLTTPQLAPFLDSNKQARKVKRKHNFSVTKD